MTALAPIPDPAHEGDEIPFPEMPGTRTEVHSVPYHHVLLVFRDDDHAMLFRQWLEGGDGWAAFGAYVGGDS